MRDSWPFISDDDFSFFGVFSKKKLPKEDSRTPKIEGINIELPKGSNVPIMDKRRLKNDC